MKSKILLSVLAAVVLLGSAPAAFAQDDGVRDSVILLATRPTVGANDSTFKIELYYWGDLDTITGVSFGWRWDNPNVQLDSAFLSAEAIGNFDLVKQVYYSGGLPATNDSQFVLCVLSRIFATGLVSDSQRHLLATYYLSVSSWTGSDVINFDTVVTGPLVASIYQIVNDFGGNEFQAVMPAVLTLQDPSDAGDLVDPNVPNEFTLAQNYPNPFNPSTNIEFSLPTHQNVTLSVYNLLGQRVRTLRDEEMDAGTYKVTWDATNDGGAKVASGVYFYKLSTEDFVETKKMMLLK